MAAPVSPAVAILMKLGVKEAEAKKDVAEGKINLCSVRGNVRDTSVVALSENCPGLRVIDLNRCSNITDASVVALVEHCPGLGEIALFDCSNITDTAKQFLRDNLFKYDDDGEYWKRDECDCYVDDDMNACKEELN